MAFYFFVFLSHVYCIIELYIIALQYLPQLRNMDKKKAVFSYFPYKREKNTAFIIPYLILLPATYLMASVVKYLWKAK